ncbi:MAG: hypothetical protein ACTSUK_00995 [Promethearchaeota archaeon]
MTITQIISTLGIEFDYTVSNDVKTIEKSFTWGSNEIELLIAYKTTDETRLIWSIEFKRNGVPFSIGSDTPFNMIKNMFDATIVEDNRTKEEQAELDSEMISSMVDSINE